MVAAAPSGEGLSGSVDRTHLPLFFQTSSSWIPWIRAMRVQRRASPAAAATCRQRAAPSSSSYRFLSRSEPRRRRPAPLCSGSQRPRAPATSRPSGEEFGSALDEEAKGAAAVAAGVRDANKRTALHFAAWEGRTEVCRFLVEQLRLPVDPKDDDDGETPLIHAAGSILETVEYLLGRGVDPSVVSNMGATTLHHAAGIGHIEIMKILLGKGVDVESESESGTPLVWAAGHGQQDAVKLLLEHNTKPNTETVDGITSLLSDVAAGSLPCLEVLIQICRRENMRWREKKGEEGER